MQNHNGTEKVVFAGNYNDAIVCAATNIDGAFTGDIVVCGALARKCRDVACRAALYGTAAVMLYEAPTPSFLGYIERLCDRAPQVIAPRHLTAEPLNLFQDVMRDTQAMSALRKGVTNEGWRLSPFIQSPGAATLAGLLDAKLDGGMCQSAVEKGLALDLNDKCAFEDACRALSIHVPESFHARGWNELSQVAQQAQNRWGDIILRQARAAGGLGNLIIKAEEDVQTALAKVADQPGWQTATVLITPFMAIESSPATMAFIGPDGTVKILCHSEQILKDGSSYVGSVTPSGLPQDIVDQMTTWMILYAQHIAKLGARGHVNIDWIVSKEFRLCACESNFRYTAILHPLAIKERLCNGDPRVARSHDALHVPGDMTFETALARLRSNGLGFNPRTRTGTVISIPPARGSMGYVVLAQDAREAAAMAREIHRLLEV